MKQLAQVKTPWKGKALMPSWKKSIKHQNAGRMVQWQLESDDDDDNLQEPQRAYKGIFQLGFNAALPTVLISFKY